MLSPIDFEGWQKPTFKVSTKMEGIHITSFDHEGLPLEPTCPQPLAR